VRRSIRSVLRLVFQTQPRSVEFSLVAVPSCAPRKPWRAIVPGM